MEIIVCYSTHHRHVEHKDDGDYVKHYVLMMIKGTK